MKNLFIIALILSLISCAPSETQGPYVDASFTKADFSSQGIAILPMGLASNVKDLNIPELRRYTGKTVFDSLTTNIAGVIVMPFEVTLDKLQGNQLFDSWSQAQSGYEQSGILRSETMDKITAATSTRFAIYPYLQAASAVSSRDYITYSAAFSFIIWDKKIQKSVYEGTSSGIAYKTLLRNETLFTAVQNAINSSIEKLLSNIK
jgi:hypothetical protein